jgi:predicted transcriptional regulator
MAVNLREELHALADRLPADATWKDVLYEAYIRQEVEAGLEEARRGEFATHEEVTSAFARWGVQIETEVDSPRTPTAR